MILGCRLDIPDISGITKEVTSFDGVFNGVAVANCAAGSVDEPCLRFHLGNEFSVKESTSLFVQRAVLPDER